MTEDWTERNQRIQDRVKAHIGQNAKVYYSAYESDRNGLPVDNLDEIAIKGKVIFYRAKGWLKEKSYRSEVLENPTYLQACKCANDSIITTGDHHHLFFEGVEIEKELIQKGERIIIASFFMGS
jgi:hypothetical protein